MWQQQYKQLVQFIAAHPQITIDKSGISIPQDVRDQFYERFDSVRRAFVDDRYSALPPELEWLSKGYIQVEKEIKELLRLDNISVPVDLQTFLQNPREGLMRAIYSRLFDLLQGKIDVATFEAQSTGDLASSASDLLSLGYERWMALNVLKLLEPDEAFSVEINDEDKTVPGELKELAFGRQAPHVTLRTPEFVIHSRRLDKYLAVKLQLATEVATYSPNVAPPIKRRRTGDTSFALDSRVMLIWVMSSLKEIPITANLEKQAVCKPDLAMECLGRNEIADPVAVDQVKRRDSILQPKIGTIIVSRDELQQQPENNIQTVAVGFDPSKLQSIVDLLNQE